MKVQYKNLEKSLKAVVFAVVLLLIAASVSLSQSSTKDVVPVLEGLDPVMLVQGKEVQGDFKITTTRGKFQYLFANAENKASFEKDPTRYEIQLEGACARMGSPVGGNPDLYSVYKGHIYIFGSGDCKKRFDAAPESYVESGSGSRGPAATTSEAAKKGRVLVEMAVTGMGGSSRIDGLTSYQEKSTTFQSRRTGEVEVKTTVTALFPGRSRFDQTMPDWNDPSALRQMTVVTTPGEVFGMMGSTVRSLPESARIDQEKEINRRLISILRARKSASLNPAALSSGKVGETAVEQVAVEIDHARYTLGIDPSTGRILSLSTWRRGPEGNFGDFIQVFSDYRNVDGLTLPFKITATFDGKPWKEQSPTIEAININGKIDPAFFEKPANAKVH